MAVPPGAYPVYPYPYPVAPLTPTPGSVPTIAGVFLILGALGGLVMAGLGFARPISSFLLCGSLMLMGVTLSIIAAVLCFMRKNHAIVLICTILVLVVTAAGAYSAIFLTNPPPPNIGFACLMAFGGGGGGAAGIAFLSLMSKRQDFTS